MSCRDCTFSIKENEQQTSCQLGILETIKTKSSKCEVVDGIYQFDRDENGKLVLIDIRGEEE